MTAIKRFNTFRELAVCKPHAVNKSLYADTFLHGAAGHWLGEPGKSVEEIDAMLSVGWQDGAMKIDEMADSMSLPIPKINKNRRKARRGSSGDELDIHRVLSGQLDRSWRQMAKARQTKGNKLMRIFCEIGGDWKRSADSLFLAPALAVAISRHMEGKGISTELVACSYISDVYQESRGDSDVYTEIRLKEFGFRVNLASLAVVAHAAFFRLWVLRSLMIKPKVCTAYLGHPERPREENMRASDKARMVFIPTMLYEDDAKKWLKEFFETH